MSTIIDKSIALEKAGGDAGLAKELFGMLLKSLPELQQRLNQAIQSDKQAFLEAAHKMYGATAYCGVPQLREFAKALEDAIKDGSDDEMLADLLNAVNHAVETLQKEGPDYIKQDWAA